MAKKGRIRAKITESKDSTNTAKRIIGRLRSKPIISIADKRLYEENKKLKEEIDSLKIELEIKSK